jgi:hypothetical protein
LEILNTLKKDDRWLGVILGALGPLAGFLIFYPVRFMPQGASVPDILKTGSAAIDANLGSLSLLVNGILFFLYTQYHKDETGRGILVITLVYVIIIIVSKLI